MAAGTMKYDRFEYDYTVDPPAAAITHLHPVVETVFVSKEDITTRNTSRS